MSVAEYNIHMEGIQFIYFFYRNISLNNYEGNNYITFLFFFSTKPVFEMKLPKLLELIVCFLASSFMYYKFTLLERRSFSFNFKKRLCYYKSYYRYLTISLITHFL